MSEFKYVYPGMVGERETRHQAIGDLAKHGDWDDGKVVAITENCLVRWQDNGPVHLGDKHYDDRCYVATKHGAVRTETRSHGLPTWTVVSVDEDTDLATAQQTDFFWANELIARDGEVYYSYGGAPLANPAFEVVGQAEHQADFTEFVGGESA